MGSSSDLKQRLCPLIDKRIKISSAAADQRPIANYRQENPSKGGEVAKHRPLTPQDGHHCVEPVVHG
jgi:hypothetical protein